MKLVNVKKGVRVIAVSDRIAEYGVVSGDTGTIIEDAVSSPWVQWDAHTNAHSNKVWALNIENLRVLKHKHFPVGTKVVLVQDVFSNYAGTCGEVVVSDGTDVPKVKLADGLGWWVPIENLGLRNE